MSKKKMKCGFLKKKIVTQVNSDVSYLKILNFNEM
jgi:hypothetical protein